MARKHVGELDADLLARVDERAKVLGQTRMKFVERALEAHLTTSDTLLERVRGARSRAPVTSAQAKAGVKPIERPSTTTQSRKGARLKK